MKKIGLVLLSILLVAGLVWQLQRATDLEDEPAVPYLAGEEYEKIKRIYTELVNAEDPRAALNKLTADMQVSKRILANCHPLVHEIGQAAYVRYQDVAESLEFRDPLCNSGYVHGVLEKRFQGLDDVAQEIQTVCGDPEATSFEAWQCFHGLGHGLMFFTINDLPRAVELCDQLDATFSRAACMNGVFMENFGGGASHQSTFVSEDSPAFPCEEQAELDKPECYVYAPTYYLYLYPNDFGGSADWCAGAGRHVDACLLGVGSEVMEQNLNDPQAVLDICSSLGDRQTSCINGAVNLLVFHRADITLAGKFCDKTTGASNTVCMSTLAELQKLFPEL